MSEFQNFYSVIVGTELLNGRRRDGHFEFVNSELNKRHLNHAGSFVIGDKPEFMERVFRFIKDDSRSVMFCFGGIGATPDDFTRFVAAKAFSGGMIETHPVAKALIEHKFGEGAYPNRIKMAELPIDAELIENPINQVPGFYVQERFFFVPGFPEMAHPMVTSVLDRFFEDGAPKSVFEVGVESSEERFVSFMQSFEGSELEISSLPAWKNGKPYVTLYLKSLDKEAVESGKKALLKEIEKLEVNFEIIKGE